PAPIEDARRRLDDLAVQERVLTREAALGVDHAERLAAIAAQRAEVEAALVGLEARWAEERELVERIRAIRGTLEELHAAPNETPHEVLNGTADADAMRAELAELNAKLDAVQGEAPLLRVAVDASIVGEVISGWTGVPVGKMVRDQLAAMLELERHLGARII